MISTTRQTELIKILKKILRAVLVTALWVFVWDIAALIISQNNELMLLLLPRPWTVFLKWWEIVLTSEFLRAVLRSLIRIFIGFTVGCTAGFLAGVLTAVFKAADYVLSPLIKVIRAVPVVAITILFFSLFESDLLPVTIVALMVTPIVWQTVLDGLKSADRPLLEMAEVYKFNGFKIFLFIKLPSIGGALLTSSVTALGFAWKSGIAAEVICEPAVALGTILMEGKGLIDFSTVYAVTLTVVLLSLVFEFVLKAISRYVLERKWQV
jgi:NitT/TauT family transport system permease protein